MNHFDSTINWLGTIFFFTAVLHTLLVDRIRDLARIFDTQTVWHKLFTFLGEVEIAFGFWAFIFFICLSSKIGMDNAVEFLNKINFTEVIFIFVMMCMAYTSPIQNLANKLINIVAVFISKTFTVHKKMALFYSIFILGTLSGSFITEPAAMTVCAMLLNNHFFRGADNIHFKYAMLALLFVNISIGGTLTIFAAPPILMLAGPWKLTNAYLFSTVGWKTIIAVFTSTMLFSFLFRKHIMNTFIKKPSTQKRRVTPFPIVGINVAFIVLAVMYHYPAFIVPLLFLFLGFYEVTKEYQRSLKVRQSLLVGFFIGGIIILGSLQSWWISPIIKSTNFLTILFGTVGLSAITDNVAITYLASQVPNLSNNIKYAFLTAAVAGGGLTVMANAPNPIGYGILNQSFGKTGIKAFMLFVWALPPTAITLLCYVFL